MRKIHDVLRLAHEQSLGIRAISRSINASPSTVGDYLRRAKVAGLTWPLPDALDEASLEWLLFKPPTTRNTQRHLPDWAYIHQERKRKGVTLALLWQEYKTEYPDGLQYSQFSERYRLWRGKLDVVMAWWAVIRGKFARLRCLSPF
jgi:transposase